MLSYRHGYHAGNHADVLKHLVLVQILDYLAVKEKPFWVIDTHAGAGGYKLTDGFAQKNCEYLNGIGRIWKAAELQSPAIKRYRDIVALFNSESTAESSSSLEYYPGSPQFSMNVLRQQDRLKLFELHSTEAPVLQELMRKGKNFSQVQVIKGDGLQGLKSLLPPVPRRAMVLIDPSYELETEYQAVPDCIVDGLKRFATGVFAVWYPVLDKESSTRMLRKLRAQLSQPWLSVQLTVSDVRAGGMMGSGMFVVNPPWILKETLLGAMPELVELLSLDDSATFKLESASP